MEQETNLIPLVEKILDGAMHKNTVQAEVMFNELDNYILATTDDNDLSEMLRMIWMNTVDIVSFHYRKELMVVIDTAFREYIERNLEK